MTNLRALVCGEIRLCFAVAKSGAVVARLFHGLLNLGNALNFAEICPDIDKLLSEFSHPGLFGSDALQLIREIGVDKWGSESHARWVGNVTKHVTLVLFDFLETFETVKAKEKTKKQERIGPAVNFLNCLLGMTKIPMPAFDLDETQLEQLYTAGNTRFSEEVLAFLQALWVGGA
jgi:hypothetical protein